MVRAVILLTDASDEFKDLLDSLWYATALIASLSIGFFAGATYARDFRRVLNVNPELSPDDDCKMVSRSLPHWNFIRLVGFCARC